MENPGALAGATGAKHVSTKNTKHYRAPGYSASPAWTGADWAHDRWAWKRAVKSDRRLSDAGKLLATSLVDDFAHHATAACTPGVELLSRCFAWSERKVQYALAELRKRGWIEVENGRRRRVRSRVLF